MSQDPHAPFDQSVLDMIENSSIGAVPHTPTYQESLGRLYASHQVYASADHKAGHVTVRSLTKLPLFHANNIDALIAGRIEPTALEPNSSIFDRYVQSLPATLRPKTESFRLQVVGRPVHHRKHQGAVSPGVHDPMHTLLLVPGTGPKHGLPGNYLYGSLFEILHAGTSSTWVVQLHDASDGASSFESATLSAALEKMQEALSSAPFHLSELAALGFKSN